MVFHKNIISKNGSQIIFFESKIDMVKANRDKFKHGVVHSFTGNEDEVKLLLDLGLYIGINGCSLKTQENLDVLKLIPTNQLMFETGKAVHCIYYNIKY